MTSKLEVKAIGGPFGGMSVDSFKNVNKRKYLEKWVEEALLYLL